MEVRHKGGSEEVFRSERMVVGCKATAGEKGTVHSAQCCTRQPDNCHKCRVSTKLDVKVNVSTKLRK